MLFSQTGELGVAKSSVSMQCCFYLEHHQVVQHWRYLMLASSKVSAPSGATSLIRRWCLWKCSLELLFLGGGVFHSDPSIIFKEQLFTFGDFKPTFLFSLILAVSFYSFFLVAFMSNCFRCTLNKIREFLLISQYWGTLWSHQLWAACHNMTLFMQERVLTKLASDVPRLNLSGKVVQVCDWLLNWYSGSHMYWWLIYFYFFKNKESVWIWYWILSLHCEPKSMPRWISMPEPTKALNIMFVTHVYWSSY